MKHCSKKLKSLKSHIKAGQDNDEFYFVPTGEKTPKALEIEEVPEDSDNASQTDKEELKKKSKRKGNRSVPVVYATRGSSMVYLPTQKKSRRYDAARPSLAITSRPEKIAN